MANSKGSRVLLGAALAVLILYAVGVIRLGNPPVYLTLVGRSSTGSGSIAAAPAGSYGRRP